MFSIVVPVRGKAHTIAATVATVLAQTYAEFELLIVGSPEDPAMVHASGFGDPRISLVRRAAEGQGSARNAGIVAGRHDWIAFIDGDDLWMPDHLAELDSIRRLFPNAGLIGTGFHDTDAAGRFEPPAAHSETIESVCLFEEIGARRKPLCTSSAAIPRHSYRSLGGFLNVPWGEDSEYWARIALCYPVVVSRRVTAIYVHGTGGLTESSDSRWSAATLKSPRDLSPPVALLIDRYDSIKSPVLRQSIDRYINRYFGWSLQVLVAKADFLAICALRKIYWGRPGVFHRMLFFIARFPPFFARPILKFVHALRSAPVILARPFKVR